MSVRSSVSTLTSERRSELLDKEEKPLDDNLWTGETYVLVGMVVGLVICVSSLVLT